MNILLYGGTFDPPHNGHVHNLLAAAACVQPQLAVVMPAGVPPHKAASHTPAALRLAMCRAAFGPLAGTPVLPRLEISDWEIQQAAAGRANYSSLTLEMLGRAHPEAALFLAVGSDMLLSFTQWHAWQDILRMATLVTVSREKDDRDALRAAARELRAAGGRVQFAHTRALPMASSRLRVRLAAGDPCPEALPAAVRAVICEAGLYGTKRI